jgi:hypothetical protein
MDKRQQQLADLNSVIKGHIPKLQIRFKNEHFWQKVVGILIWIFNRGYMKNYVTVFGANVYFPSKEHYESNPVMSFNILAHEFVHLLDSKKNPFWFKISYLFPQCLSVFALGAFAAFYSLWFLFFLLFLICLAPWPAPFRKKIELRGYTMNIAVSYWRYGYFPKTDWTVRALTKSEYYFTCWSKKHIVKQLKDIKKKVEAGAKFGTVGEAVYKILKEGEDK